MPIIERVICSTIKYLTENKDVNNQKHFQQNHSWTKEKGLLLFQTWIIRFQAVVSIAVTPALLWEPDTLSQNKVPLLFWRQLLEGQKAAFLHHANFGASWAFSPFLTQYWHHSVQCYYKNLLCNSVTQCHHGIWAFLTWPHPCILQLQVTQHMEHQTSPSQWWVINIRRNENTTRRTFAAFSSSW